MPQEKISLFKLIVISVVNKTRNRTNKIVPINIPFYQHNYTLSNDMPN